MKVVLVNIVRRLRMSKLYTVKAEETVLVIYEVNAKNKKDARKKAYDLFLDYYENDYIARNTATQNIVEVEESNNE